MLNNLKALVVVLAIACAVFYAFKPLCLKVMEERVFKLRRNVWLVLTAAAFTMPSFWLYVAIALVVLFIAVREDPQPVALFPLLILVIPIGDYAVPFPGINFLFELNNLRLLVLAVLVPALLAQWRVEGRSADRRLHGLEWLVLSFLALQWVRHTEIETATGTMRSIFVSILDIFVVTYAIRRLASTRKALLNSLLMFTLVMAIYSLVGAFEAARSWLLYTGIQAVWGEVTKGAFLFRGSLLRAQASAGHSLPLGYAVAMALTFWMVIGRPHYSRKLFFGVVAVYCAGLYATSARGPWVTAAFSVIVVIVSTSPSALKALQQLSLVFVPLAAFLLSPLGDSIVEKLPFIGTQAQGTVEYRQLIWETSIPLIQRNPLFGDLFVLRYMENLRQGEGIIDLMNYYVQISLFYGLVGLVLFVLPLLAPIPGTWRLARRLRQADPMLTRLAMALVAALLGTLVFMGTANFAFMLYPILGFLLACQQQMKLAVSVRARLAPDGLTPMSATQPARAR